MQFLDKSSGANITETISILPCDLQLDCQVTFPFPSGFQTSIALLLFVQSTSIRSFFCWWVIGIESIIIDDFHYWSLFSTYPNKLFKPRQSLFYFLWFDISMNCVNFMGLPTVQEITMNNFNLMICLHF